MTESEQFNANLVKRVKDLMNQNDKFKEELALYIEQCRDQEDEGKKLLRENNELKKQNDELRKQLRDTMDDISNREKQVQKKEPKKKSEIDNKINTLFKK